MERQDFYTELKVLLRDLKPDLDAREPEPDTHLWVAGYVDSLAMLEIVFFLEERLGRELDLDGDFLPSFFTMDAIYDTYVAPSLSA